MSNWEIWLKGIAAAGIAGGANGVFTGFAAVRSRWQDRSDTVPPVKSFRLSSIAV
jgi:hypothetical protein